MLVWAEGCLFFLKRLVMFMSPDWNRGLRTLLSIKLKLQKSEITKVIRLNNLQKDINDKHIFFILIFLKGGKDDHLFLNNAPITTNQPSLVKYLSSRWRLLL